MISKKEDVLGQDVDELYNSAGKMYVYALMPMHSLYNL